MLLLRMPKINHYTFTSMLHSYRNQSIDLIWVINLQGSLNLVPWFNLAMWHRVGRLVKWNVSVHPFYATDLFWYPLKRSENLWFSKGTNSRTTQTNFESIWKIQEDSTDGCQKFVMPAVFIISRVLDLAPTLYMVLGITECVFMGKVNWP